MVTSSHENEATKPLYHKMASSISEQRVIITLTENDIPGASLLGRKPEQLKNDELKFWLKCRGDVAKGLKTKAQLVKRVYEYINSGKDKNIVDPDPNSIYSRRKARKDAILHVAPNDGDADAERVVFPTDGWETSLEKMPLFTKAEMNEHICNSGKRFGNIDHHSIPTNLMKAKKFLDDEYLEEIESLYDDKHFYFRAKCCHSFRKNDPPHKLNIALCIISGQVKRSSCSCVAGKAGYCNHVLALMFKVCKFSLYACKETSDLREEEDQQSSTSCTSTLQKWHKKGGGSNIAPEPVLEVFIKKTKMDVHVDAGKSCVKPLLYEARKNPAHSVNDEKTLKADFHNLNSNVGFGHMYLDNSTPESIETKYGKFQVGSCLSYQLAFTESNFKAFSDINIVARAVVPLMNPIYPHFPLNEMNEMDIPNNLIQHELELINKLNVSQHDVNEIEKETREQSKSKRWKEERKLRFTASNFHLISRRQRNHNTLADNLMNPKEISSRNFEHGRRYEPIALMAYEKFMYNKNTPVQVLKCGFVVDKGYPILGASPDGKVIDTGCVHPYGIAEVKCPITKFQVTPLDACSDPNFFMSKSGENQCTLKHSHPYYAQVQGQLGVTGAKWCDFIVYTKVGLYVERITLNVVFWEELKDKLLRYYFEHFIKFASLSLASNDSNDD